MEISTSVRRSVARDLDISEQYLYQCITGRKCMRPEEAVRVEQKSNGRIKRWHLRRSDWHLIWPELIGAVGAPTIVTCDVNEPTQQAQAAINHDVQGVVHG